MFYCATEATVSWSCDVCSVVLSLLHGCLIIGPSPVCATILQYRCCMSFSSSYHYELCAIASRVRSFICCKCNHHYQDPRCQTAKAVCAAKAKSQEHKQDECCFFFIQSSLSRSALSDSAAKAVCAAKAKLSSVSVCNSHAVNAFARA